ncbi:MAG: hypothetical protein R2882_08975 [Gemmatimonadales bacterium]
MSIRSVEPAVGAWLPAGWARWARTRISSSWTGVLVIRRSVTIRSSSAWRTTVRWTGIRPMYRAVIRY